MAIAIAPWSIVLTPGKAEAFVPQGDLQIKNAALPDELQDDSARTSVKLTYKSLASLDDEDDDEDEDEDELPEGIAVTTVLCSLTPGKIEQATCEIILEQDTEYILEAVGKNTIHLYGNYIDQAPVDQPPLGSDVDSDEEDAYDLNKVSSDVEVPLVPHEADLDDEVEDEDADRFEEIQDEQESPKNLKRPREDAMDIDEHDEKLSKSQRKKLAKKLKAADGKPVPAPEPEQKAEKVGKKEKKDQGEKEKEKSEKKEKSEQKDGEKKKKESKGDGKNTTVLRTVEGGVQVRDATIGTGKTAKKGDKLQIRYIGNLPDGTVFDKNVKGKPFTFTLGQGDVIKGWDIGVTGMQVGGEREVVIPPAMGYGNKKTSDIPANSTLRFEVKLLRIK